jgi:hypothetical protein
MHGPTFDIVGGSVVSMPELLDLQREAVAQRNRLFGSVRPLGVDVLLIPR